MKVKQNLARLNHLLKLYKISVDEFLTIINASLKKSINREDVFSEEINLNYLKRIDKLFNKGLAYYLDPKEPESSREASIFFRKPSFNSDLNLGARKIVNRFEELKISLSAIAKLAELRIDRSLPTYGVTDNSRTVANEIRSRLYPPFSNNLKIFLKALISRLADYNIFVFEFVETWNQKNKANIDGFF